MYTLGVMPKIGTLFTFTNNNLNCMSIECVLNFVTSVPFTTTYNQSQFVVVGK